MHQFIEDTSLLKKTIISYCLSCRKNIERQKTEEYCFYQNVQCVIVKHQSLSKNKKLADY